MEGGWPWTRKEKEKETEKAQQREAEMKEHEAQVRRRVYAQIQEKDIKSAQKLNPTRCK